MKILVDNKPGSSKLEIDSENDALLASISLDITEGIINSLSSWTIIEINGKDFCVISMIRADFFMFNSNLSIIPLNKEMIFYFITECQTALSEIKEGSKEESFWAAKIVKLDKILSHY
ncbi:MAG: hypothetical protein L3J07_03795 [Candidatus Magasanikbacteria bacterium]|nr:hypothetical protein [Candidatus Magasanikbacteria bacterium]